MRKRNLLLFLCLCLIGLFTTACGGGGKTTPPNNSAYYYLLAQQNANNNEQEQQNEPTPDPSPTSDPSPTPDPSPTSVNPFADAQVGDFVEFGHYRQTGDDNVDPEEWEPQPIEWKVLAIDSENNRALVISPYGLDAMRFDDNSNDWENSEICGWLNGEFYHTAFDETEKAKINATKLSDIDGETYNVFLLSYGEATNTKYFADAGARQCLATAYAKKHGANTYEGYGYWWLRSKGNIIVPSVYYAPGRFAPRR